MMSGSLYYGVQFAQSLYNLLWECGRMEETPDRVFAARTDISSSYEGCLCNGREDVRILYREYVHRLEENGGFCRVDLPASPYVEASTDGSEAVLHSLTMTKQLERTGSGEQIRTRIGRFTNSFVPEDGIWKLRDFRWEPLCEFEADSVTPDMNLEKYRKDPKAWIRELPSLKPLRDEGVTRKTAEILFLRNEILSWFCRPAEQEQTADISCATDGVRSELEAFMQSSPYILVTSPVLRMSEDLKMAEAFFSASAFGETTGNCMIDTRGSLDIHLVNDDDGWTVSRFGWYPYASLEPWTVRRSWRSLQIN